MNEVAVFPPQNMTTPSAIQVAIPSTVQLHYYKRYTIKVSVFVENDAAKSLG